MDNIKAILKMRYDTYENWFSTEKKDKVLEQGEIGFCLVEGENSENLKPGVYFKVGNNADTYETLPWFQARAIDVPDYAKQTETLFIDWVNKSLLDTDYVVQKGVTEIKCPIDPQVVTEAEVEFIYREEGEASRHELYLSYLNSSHMEVSGSILTTQITSRYFRIIGNPRNSWGFGGDWEVTTLNSNDEKIIISRNESGLYELPEDYNDIQFYHYATSFEYDGMTFSPEAFVAIDNVFVEFVSAGDQTVKIYSGDSYIHSCTLKEKWTLPKHHYSKVLHTEPETYMNITWKRVSFKETIFNEIFTTQEVEYNEEYTNNCSIDGNGTVTVSSNEPMVVRWATEKTPDLSWKAEDFIGTWKLTDTFFENFVSTDFDISSIQFYSNGKYYTNISCNNNSLYFGDDLVYYNNNIMNVNYQYITIGESMKEVITNDEFYINLGYYLKQYGKKTTLQKTVLPGFYSFKENESYAQFADDMPEGEFHIKFKAKGQMHDSVLKKSRTKYIGTQIYLDGTLIYPLLIGTIDERILNFATFEIQSADYNVVTWFESKMTCQLYDTLTMDDRCSYKLYSTNVNCVTNGVKDAMYEGGLHFPATYGRPKKPSLDTFDIYMTANKNKVYVLYEITDNNIISNADMFYRNDCADIIISLAAEATGQELRIFGSREGDINTALYYINDTLGTATNLKNFGISELCVKYTDIGYNVEFAIDRSKFALFNKFSFLGMATCATSASDRVYPCTVNAYAWNGNQAKAALNEVIIMDAPALTEDGRFAYRLNAITTASDRPGSSPYDYEREDAYRAGLKFTPTYNLVDDKNTFTVYLGATTFGANDGGGCLVVKYEVKDESIILASDTNYWWNDCIDFILNTNGAASGGNEFRIEGRTETTSSNGTAHSLPNYIQEYFVTHTDEGYDVEFVIPRSALANYDNFSFMAFITAAISATSRKYPCIENASYKDAKNKLNYVTIINDTHLDSWSSWNGSMTFASSNIHPDTTKISVSGFATQGSVDLTFYDSLDNILSSYSLNDPFDLVEYFVPFGAKKFSIQIKGATSWYVTARQLTSDPIIDSSLSNYEIISQNLYTADQNLIDIPEGATKVKVVGTYNNYLNNNSAIKFTMVDNTSTEVITHNIATITAAPTENYGINKIFDIPDAAVKCGFDATGDPTTYDEAFKCNIEVTFLKEIVPISDAQVQGTWSFRRASAQELGKGEYNLGFIAWNDLSNQWEEASAMVKTEEDFTIRFRSGYVSSDFTNNITIFDASTLSNYFKKWIVDNATKVEDETSSELIGLWEMKDDTTATFGDMPIGSSIRVNFLDQANVRFYQETTQAVYVGDTWVAQVGDYGGIGKFTLEVVDAQKLDEQFKTWFLSHFSKITAFSDLKGVWQCNGNLGDVFYDCQGKHSFEFISAGEMFTSLSILEPFMAEPTIYYDTNVIDLGGQYGVITINSLAKVSNSFVQAFNQAFTKISDIPNARELGIAETNNVNSLSEISIAEKAIAIKLYGEITPDLAQVNVQCLTTEGEVLLNIPLTGTMDDPTYSELFFYLPENTKMIKFVSSNEPITCEITVEQYKDYLYSTWQIVDVDGFIEEMHNNHPGIEGATDYYNVSFTWSKTDGSFTKECSTISITGMSYDSGGPVNLSHGYFGDTEVYSYVYGYNTILTEQDQITIHSITSDRDFIRNLLTNYCFNIDYLKGEYYLDFDQLEAVYVNDDGYENYGQITESIVFTADGIQYDSIQYYREGSAPEDVPYFVISYDGSNNSKMVYKYYTSKPSEEEPNMRYINIISCSQISKYLLKSLTRCVTTNTQYRSMFNLRRNVGNEIIIQPEGEIMILPSSPKTLIPNLPLQYNFGTIGDGNVTFNTTYIVEEKVNKADFVEAQLRKEINNLMEMIEELRTEIDALTNQKTEVELVTWNGED